MNNKFILTSLLVLALAGNSVIQHLAVCLQEDPSLILCLLCFLYCRTWENRLYHIPEDRSIFNRKENCVPAV